MSPNTITTAYQAYFIDLNLERREVFETVRAWISGETVLYPGSFIHIAPSYYFQHVVYVDRTPFSAQFFAETQSVAEYVTGRKHYKQQPYIRFLAQDYTTPLPLRVQSFDLLLALYAGGIAQACAAYLKRGGILLSNNHHDDAGEAARSGAYELVGVMQQHRTAYRISTDDLAGYFVPKSGSLSQYTRRADYYLFRKR